jgi:DNA invertase Pin-like site-specific DNA recombinase
MDRSDVVAPITVIASSVITTEQTVENQQRQLEAVAERHGWNVVAVFTDAEISGIKGP